jgi:RND family efflux transporter MFP subunit
MALLSAGCGKQEAAPAQAAGAKKDQVPTVTVVRPQQRTIQRIIEQPAQVEAIEITPLYAKIPGYVAKVCCDIGDRVEGPTLDGEGEVVKAGTVLAEISVPELVKELKQKEAMIAQARAEVEQSNRALDAAEAAVATARALIQQAESARKGALANYERWQSEYQRVEGLVARQVIDQQILDETRNQFKAAEATREEVEARVRSAQAGAQESQAKRDKARADCDACAAAVQVAEAAKEHVEERLEYTHICAPFNGVVTVRNIHTRDFVQPSSKPMFVVALTDIIRVVANIPEAEAHLIRKGIDARIQVQCEGAAGTATRKDFTGTVTRTSWAIDPLSRTLRTEIHLPNADAKFMAGMYAYVRLTVEFRDLLTIPATAVATQGEQEVCYLLQDGKVYRTPIRIGRRDSKSVEVLQKLVRSTNPDDEGKWVDLAGDEMVVQGKLADLSDGMTVQVAESQK